MLGIPALELLVYHKLNGIKGQVSKKKGSIPCIQAPSPFLCKNRLDLISLKEDIQGEVRNYKRLMYASLPQGHEDLPLGLVPEIPWSVALT